jgi:hypothetical protein
VDHILWLLAASGALLTRPAAPAFPDSVLTVAREAEEGAPVPDSTTVPPEARGPVLASRFVPFTPSPFASDSTEQRPLAVEYSDFYYARLTVHRIASYATLPLFVAEYLLGTQLYKNPPGSRSTQQAHRAVALGVAGLFVVNTVTGAWNLWESRKDPAGRARRYIHAALMFAADAGFVATGSSAPSPRRILLSGSAVNLSRHRTIAIASMGTALASYAMMLIWKN